MSTGLTNRGDRRAAVAEREDGRASLSNIFGKLGLSSRAAATAYAYENGLSSEAAAGIAPLHMPAPTRLHNSAHRAIA